jgi:hypothetical protein
MVALSAVGCGGRSGSSGSSTANSKDSTGDSAGTTTSKDSSASESPPASTGNSEPSTEFLGKGTNGKLATQGEVAALAEREAASRVIERSMRARAARDWAGQCAELADLIATKLEENASFVGAKSDCADAVARQAEQAPDSALASTLTGPIDVLRVNFDEGFAFYHGTGGKDYVIPLRKEGGEWKLESLTEAEIPK